MGSFGFLLEIQNETPDMSLLDVVKLSRQAVLPKEPEEPQQE